MNSNAKELFVVNAGSTSLKAAQYLLSHSAPENPSLIKQIGRASIDTKLDTVGVDLEYADKLLAEIATRVPELDSSPDIVAHRIVHGGDLDGPTDLTPAVVHELEALSHLAPMHQPLSLALVQASRRRWPEARQIGVFDTSWHRTMPEKHRVFAIPYNFYSQGVKRFGFHGLAFQSAMRQLIAIAPDMALKRIVLAHLGGGSSLCAVLEGCSVNTTMGMTPLGGIPMAYRSGSLDPGMLIHVQSRLGMSAAEIERMLWNASGMKGISGESGDMRKLLASSSARALLAIDVYVSGVVQGIAEMAACIHGIDALVFTGGIGANADEIRSRIMNELEWLGLKADPTANRANAPEISLAESDVRAFTLSIDEELEIANSISF